MKAIIGKKVGMSQIFDENGKVIHTQDSSFLEEGNGYNKEKVLRFFNCWTPKATL